MKKLLAITFTLCALSVFSFAQTSAKADASLEASMQKFRASIINKKPTVFLSFISKTKGLTMMNTINQGEAGNEDKPMFISKLKYAALAADFKKRGDNYQDFFTKSKFDASLYDNVLNYRGNWKSVAADKFMPLEKGKPVKALYVRWEKEGDRWVAVELGRPLS